MRVFVYPYFFPQNLENSNQKAFPCLSIKNIILSTSSSETPHFVETSFLQGPKLIIILCIFTFVYVSAVLNFVSAIRSGTYQLLPHIFFSSCFHWTLFFFMYKPDSLNNVQTTACLSCIKWPWNSVLRNTRQAEHDSTATGQAKLATESPDVTSVYGYEHSVFYPYDSFFIINFLFYP